MWRCLEADLEILVHQGYLYVPLLLDPEIQQETQVLGLGGSTGPVSSLASPSHPGPAVLAVQDRLFVQAISVSSLVDNYAGLFPQEYDTRRNRLLEHYSLTADLWGVFLHPKLITIVFHILPHFLRRDELSPRRPLGEGEILDLIRQRIHIPPHFDQEARRFLDREPLQEALRRLETASVEPQPPPEGLISAAVLQSWWEDTLSARLLAEERIRLIRELEDREYWAAAQKGRLGVLLYLADKGSLELDGFGFTRLNKGQDYRIYKRTGPYVLKDFFGRLYLFPDCRVAVTTMGRLRPVVVDHYKHPFLRRHGPGQAICVGHENHGLDFSSENVIRALEEGITALLYSYDDRMGRGYHKLDALPGRMQLVDFQDYRIRPDHPFLLSGQVEGKNHIT